MQNPSPDSGTLAKRERVNLWAGWSIELPPPARYQRNDDGSWSAWGKDWTVDVHIIEISGDKHGIPVPAEQMLGKVGGGKPVSGKGWTGITELLMENDDGRDVYRLAGRLGAENTLMSCWVSYMREEQRVLAEALIGAVVHQ